MTNHVESSKSRLIIGATVLVIGFMSPLLIPFIVASDLSDTHIKIISALLAFGIPELFMIIAVAIMGKQGYEFIKEKVFKYLKRFAPSDSVSLTRHRIGLIFFCTPLIIGVLQPYLSQYFIIFKSAPIWTTIILDLLFISSLFVLGGDFWDKLRGLFRHKTKV